MMFRNGTELENTRATGWWTAHTKGKLGRTSHDSTGSTDLTHLHARSPTRLWHVQFLLLISHLSKIFPHIQILLPSGFGGSTTTCFTPFRFPLKSPGHLTVRIKSSTFSTLSDHHLCTHPGWSCWSVGNLIQYATWPKRAKRSLSSLPQLSALISHIIQRSGQGL